jgi:hypothetical protein
MSWTLISGWLATEDMASKCSTALTTDFAADTISGAALAHPTIVNIRNTPCRGPNIVAIDPERDVNSM